MKDTCLDGSELLDGIDPALVEEGAPFGGHELFFVAVPDREPVTRGPKKLRGEVELLHVLEAGPLDEVNVVAPAGADEGRAGPQRLSVEPFRQTIRDEYREESQAAAPAQNSSACSQHGELTAYASERIGMSYGVERSHRKGRTVATGPDHANSMA